jgi:SOUL heme-binding protein
MHGHSPTSRLVAADPTLCRRRRMRAGRSMTGFASLRGRRADLAQYLAHLLSAERRLLRRSTLPREAVVAMIGPVELRATSPGIVVRTTVKGQRDAALQTALRRLADYTGGQNREALAVPTARPITQLPGAPGTWVVQVGLPHVNATSAAPVPCGGRVRITTQPSEMLAVIRLNGRPRDDALARGEAAIIAAIAGTAWTASGPVMLRLHAPPGLLPWTAGFEVAMAITEV